MNSYMAKPPRIAAAEVKAAAKSRLREGDNYRRTALMLGLMMLLTNVPVMLMNYLSTAFTDLSRLDEGMLNMIAMRMLLFQLLVALLVTPAFTLSEARFMLRLMRDRAGSPGDLFDGLGRGSYFVSIRAVLWRVLMLYGWTIMPLLIFVQGWTMTALYGPASGLAPTLLGGVLCIIILINRALAYSLQFYYLAEQPRLGAVMALRLSIISMHGRMKELFLLMLHLLPYMLPPMLPSIATTLFLQDNALFGIAMAACSIVLSAMFLPMVEASMAEYFLRIKAQMSNQAAAAQQVQSTEWPDASQPEDSEDDEDSKDNQDDQSQSNDDEIRH